MSIKVIGRDIYVDQYDCGVDIKFNLTNPDGTPFDLSGYTAQFIVKKNKNDDDDLQALEDITISDFVDNVIAVPIDKHLSDNPVGTYYYAIRLFKNGDFINTIIQAKFYIRDNTFDNGVE